MEFQLIQNAEGFSQLRPEWNHLLCRSAADTIFLTWEWLFSWWESYRGPDDVLHIVTVRENSGELVGVLPLYVNKHRWLRVLPIRKLYLIGDGSDDSDYLDSILLEGREEEILDGAWNFITSKGASSSLFQLTGIPEASGTIAWLTRVAAEGRVVCRKDTMPCAVTDLPESWDDYLGSLKPRFRTKIRSTLRELSASYRVRFYSIDKQADLHKGLEILFELHGKRWALREAQGVFRGEAKRKFYERFTQLFLERGWLAFDFLELDGKAAACQMCFRYGNTQFLLQEGFDPRFADESVGIALRALVFKKAIDDGIKHYDFLAGVGRHKTQWQARIKHCCTVSVGQKTIPNIIYIKTPLVIAALRERVKAVLPHKILEIRRRLVASRHLQSQTHA